MDSKTIENIIEMLKKSNESELYIIESFIKSIIKRPA